MKKIRAGFCLLIGFMMISFWSFLIISRGIASEFSLEPVRLSFHIVSEILTGILLVLAGFMLLGSRRIGNALYNIATGALIYSVINALGFYSQYLNAVLVAMFAVIFVAALVLLLISFYWKKAE